MSDGREGELTRAQLRRDPTAGAEPGGNPEAVPRGSGQQKERSGVEAGTRKGMGAREKKREKKREKEARQNARGAAARGVCASPRRERRKEADGGGWIFCGSKSLRRAARCAALAWVRLSYMTHTAHAMLRWCIGSEGSGICSFSENFRGFISRNDTVACAEA